ncbi:hypothetical protein H072_4476 [Dactylellina haptotyla CBS 200.50]|uniref:NAD-dependent epimerase/dehydratase domain-containing protein n=1 Tax=Dactylellina haptotyla (strain CBS 200.50) TaxID=1284197 RepID=S8AKC4_DACHA|nr:hypothetical protein H072_4476 [Dactylellina haptotyla CBS 200.50]
MDQRRRPISGSSFLAIAVSHSWPTSLLAILPQSNPAWALLHTPAVAPRLHLPEHRYRQFIIRVIEFLTAVPCCINTPQPAYRNPAVLVTGGLGFVGSHVCLELLRREHRVIIIDDLSNSYSEAVGGIFRALGRDDDKNGGLRTVQLVDHIPVDYGNTKAVFSLLACYREKFEIMGVIHLAAFKSVAESVEYPEKCYENNVVKTVNFLRVLGGLGIANVVFASSAAVYGGLQQNGSSGDPLIEDMVPIYDSFNTKGSHQKEANGLSPYGISKLVGESLVSRFTAENTNRRSIVFRLFNPVGCDPSGYLKETPRDEKWCGGNVMQMILKTITGEKETFDLYGTDYFNEGSCDGTCVRDYVHVGDIAVAMVMGLEACFFHRTDSRQRCRVYNLASGKGVSVKQLIRSVEDHRGIVIRTRMRGRRKGDMAISIGSREKVTRELQWAPRMSLADICRDFCRCYGIASR